MTNHPNRKRADFGLSRCDETSPYHTGKGRSYVVTYRGQMIGHLDIHTNGYRDWSFTAGQPRPSRTTQGRLVKTVRNDSSRANLNQLILS
jgi:hypothetical protein